MKIRSPKPRGSTQQIVCALVVIVLAISQLAAAADSCDALCRRVRAELADFTGWLEEGGVRGYIGEVGWPDESSGDGASWNALADGWYADADEAGLAVTAWATGSAWGTSYALADYEDRQPGRGVDTPNTQASAIESHLGAERGVNVAGGEFGTPSVEETSRFSNASPGRSGAEYTFDPAETFRFLASRGVRLVRIPFRWERVQPLPGGPLDDAAVADLRAVITRAHTAGLRAVVDMHNYGAYYLFDGSRGVRRAIGSDQVTKAHFADVWRRLSRVFRGAPGVHAYGLMNEPVGMSPKAGLTAARRWEIVSQAALDAIRRNGDRTTIMVAGYEWSGAHRWSSVHPRPWIRDRTNRFRYEAHHYWDADHSGTYRRSYAQEVATADAQGF